MEDGALRSSRSLLWRKCYALTAVDHCCEGKVEHWQQLITAVKEELCIDISWSLLLRKCYALTAVDHCCEGRVAYWQQLITAVKEELSIDSSWSLLWRKVVHWQQLITGVKEVLCFDSSWSLLWRKSRLLTAVDHCCEGRVVLWQQLITAVNEELIIYFCEGRVNYSLLRITIFPNSDTIKKVEYFQRISRFFEKNQK
jgi:hypothetical protein